MLCCVFVCISRVCITVCVCHALLFCREVYGTGFDVLEYITLAPLPEVSVCGPRFPLFCERQPVDILVPVNATRSGLVSPWRSKCCFDSCLPAFAEYMRRVHMARASVVASIYGRVTYVNLTPAHPPRMSFGLTREQVFGSVCVFFVEVMCV